MPQESDTIEPVADRRYGIGEVSEMVGVPAYTLRQWESKVPQLNPKRNRAKCRYYMAADIAIVRRLKWLVKHEKMTIEGARLWIAQELHGEGRPRTNQEAVDLLDKIEDEVRAMLAILDSG